MSGKVSARAKNAKSGHTQNRNQIPQTGNQISPVMQIVRGWLPDRKAAQTLAFLTDLPLSTCQKLLSGERSENREQLEVLLHLECGREILFCLMGEARPDWFGKYRKQLDVVDARKQLQENQRRIEALQAEVFG